jgi:hypothetical protein
MAIDAPGYRFANKNSYGVRQLKSELTVFVYALILKLISVMFDG